MIPNQPAMPMGAQPMGTQPLGAQPMGAQPMGTQFMGAQPLGQQPMAPQPVAAPAPVAPIAPSREPARVIVYGQSGCVSVMDAIRDLMDRQISFVYYDVARDQQARAHLQAICGASDPVVPVIVHIGFGGT